jgi:hypothetical protein
MEVVADLVLAKMNNLSYAMNYETEPFSLVEIEEDGEIEVPNAVALDMDFISFEFPYEHVAIAGERQVSLVSRRMSYEKFPHQDSRQLIYPAIMENIKALKKILKVLSSMPIAAYNDFVKKSDEFLKILYTTQKLIKSLVWAFAVRESKVVVYLKVWDEQLFITGENTDLYTKRIELTPETLLHEKIRARECGLKQLKYYTKEELEQLDKTLAPIDDRPLWEKGELTDLKWNEVKDKKQ